MRLALFQPDIPQNFGAMVRLTACMGVPLDLIHPCGFVLADKHLKRAAMDYIDLAHVIEHADWATFLSTRSSGRLVLMTTRASVALSDFGFAPDDCLLMGQESCGVPEHVHALCDARIHIPMVAGARSLNMANAASIALYEALRQVSGLPVQHTV
jgi:tRNA (cytidine/uridine-2'-O-)-methyltransferase